MRGEAEKGTGEGDNDKRGSCGSFNILKEIETENEIYIFKNDPLCFAPLLKESVENGKDF